MIGIFVVSVLAILAALTAVYAFRVTFPGYKGRGGVGVLLTVMALGLAALWVLGAWAGINVWSDLPELTTFAWNWDGDGKLQGDIVIMWIGILFAAAVASHNLYVEGRVDQ